MSTVKHNPNLTFYTKENIEGELSGQYKSWWGNKTSAVLKIFEDNYLKNVEKLTFFTNYAITPQPKRVMT